MGEHKQQYFGTWIKPQMLILHLGLFMKGRIFVIKKWEANAEHLVAADWSISVVYRGAGHRRGL